MPRQASTRSPSIGLRASSLIRKNVIRRTGCGETTYLISTTHMALRARSSPRRSQATPMPSTKKKSSSSRCADRSSRRRASPSSRLFQKAKTRVSVSASTYPCRTVMRRGSMRRARCSSTPWRPALLWVVDRTSPAHRVLRRQCVIRSTERSTNVSSHSAASSIRAPCSIGAACSSGETTHSGSAVRHHLAAG